MHPRDAVRRIPKVGGTKSVKLEAVRALKPTHVIRKVMLRMQAIFNYINPF